MITPSSTNRLLISDESFAPYKSICVNSRPADIMPYVQDAQMFDLVTVLPEELIIDLQDNPELPRNVALLPWVRPVLCYYSYARYITFTGVTDTASGFVQKTNEFSTPASTAAITRIKQEALNIAAGFASKLIRFLNDNAATYPLWTGSCRPNSPTKSGSNISDISLR